MSITRRDALAAVVGCGLTTTAAAGADDKLAVPKGPTPVDPAYSNVPAAVRKVFESTFPNHRCIRMGIRGEENAAVYRGILIDASYTGTATTQRLLDGELVTTPRLYHLEVNAGGKVVEEMPHPIDPKVLPKAVAAAYEKWNPKEVKRMADVWTTEVPRGKERVYSVFILVNAIKSYSASFKEDGTVVKADPITP